MKTCPVCKSLCFDDMSVCYGCMHDFEREAFGAPSTPNPVVSQAAQITDKTAVPGKVALDIGSASRALSENAQPGETSRANGEASAPVRSSGASLPQEGARSVEDMRKRHAGTRSFGTSGSAAPADYGARPVMSLPIPMITSAFTRPQRSNDDIEPGATARIAACERADVVSAGLSSSPWLTFETPSGCRLVLHLEST